MSALNRREAILAAAAASRLGARGLLSPRDAGAASCLLQREVTEGPYYLDLDLVRRNIKGGRKGTPLTLRFQVVDATTCKPIPNAAVEIWHADADGAYSGVQGNRGTWLRGIQRTGANGRVRFETIFPGWYPRADAAHPHEGVRLGRRGPHGPGVLRRHREARRLRPGPLRRARPVRDVQPRRLIYREAGNRALLELRRKGSRRSAPATPARS